MRSSGKAGMTRHHERGMTLVELLVVLAILSLLALLIAPNVLGYLGKARTQTAQSQLDNLVTAIDLFHLDTGRYPRAEEGLSALVTAPAGQAGWQGPYLRKKVALSDPWGNAFHYRYPGQNGPYDLYSLGADNAVGGEGDDRDVTNW